jgi:hypothetical protein
MLPAVGNRLLGFPPARVVAGGGSESVGTAADAGASFVAAAAGPPNEPPLAVDGRLMMTRPREGSGDGGMSDGDEGETLPADGTIGLAGNAGEDSVGASSEPSGVIVLDDMLLTGGGAMVVGRAEAGAGVMSGRAVAAAVAVASERVARGGSDAVECGAVASDAALWIVGNGAVGVEGCSCSLDIILGPEGPLTAEPEG